MYSLANTKTQYSEFCDWWVTGLTYLVPGSMQHLINPPRDYITVEINGDNVTFGQFRDDSPGKLDERYFLTSQDEIQKTATINWLNEQQQKGAELVLLIPDQNVLQKPISLPSATEDNLRQVLGFEMDRRTPFTADQVYFDYHIENRDTVVKQLHIQLFATPKNKIDELIAMLDAWGIQINAVSIKQHINDINFLPVEKRTLKENGKEKSITLVLAVAAFCLFMMALYLPLLKQEQAIKDLEVKVSESRTIALKIKELEKQRDNIFNRSSFLISKRNSTLPVIEIIDELTRLIPDDTWLTRFAITKGEIQIQGESDTASSLISTIESSENFAEARFRSPVTRNNISKKDKFNLTARIVQ